MTTNADTALSDEADELVVATTTTPSRAAAQELAATVVERRWAACAQLVGPLTSVYRWDGAVRTDPEWRVELKTRASLIPAIEAHLAGWHEYDVPELIATPIVGGSAAYLDWVRAETAAR